LLDDGTLFAARYNADGNVDRLPLVFGQGTLTAANGFNSQTDVLIETRRAADLLGATKMDRPEDVEANPKTGRVYVILTNNSNRKPEQVDAANPRAKQPVRSHHRDDPAGRRPCDRQIPLGSPSKCGDPAVAAVCASFSSATTRDGSFGMPDNCAFDADGRLWIATDGNSDRDTGHADGLWGLETEGERRGTSKLFFRCPVGAELMRPGIHARRRDPVRGHPASRRRRSEVEGIRPAVDLCGSFDALAGLRTEAAAAAVRLGDYLARRRQDRQLITSAAAGDRRLARNQPRVGIAPRDHFSMWGSIFGRPEVVMTSSPGPMPPAQMLKWSLPSRSILRWRSAYRCNRRRLI
jgi:hypothetical protein